MSKCLKSKKVAANIKVEREGKHLIIDLKVSVMYKGGGGLDKVKKICSALKLFDIFYIF